jgi:hypothetical protein
LQPFLKILQKLSIGEMAEWSNAVVLKTIVPKGTGGSNPSLSAAQKTFAKARGFVISDPNIENPFS